jgi:hypothetical protein
MNPQHEPHQIDSC